MRQLHPVRRGFTLVEILIVVIILGILAAVVVPSFASATQSAGETAFAAEMRSFGTQLEYYMADTNEVLPDGSSGVLHADLVGYVNESQWEAGTPVGGVWDTESDPECFGVHFDGTGETRDAAYMLAIDEMMDDGDLTTGAFQQIDGDRFYYILDD